MSPSESKICQPSPNTTHSLAVESASNYENNIITDYKSKESSNLESLSKILFSTTSTSVKTSESITTSSSALSKPEMSSNETSTLTFASKSSRTSSSALSKPKVSSSISMDTSKTYENPP